MKKVISLFLTLTSVIFLCACSNSSITSTKKNTTKTNQVATSEMKTNSSTSKVISTTEKKDSEFGTMYIPNLAVYQEFPKYIPVYFSKDRYDVSYTYDSENIKIENGVIYVLEPSDNYIVVKATTEHHETTFKVKACGEYVTLANTSTNFKAKYEQRKSTVESMLLKNGTPVDNSMIFIGDSFFDTDSFYTNFYSVYSGKNIVSIGINSATTREVLEWINTLVIPYSPKSLVIHIGTNDLGVLKLSETAVARNVIEVLSVLHVLLPETNIYWASIEYRKASHDSSISYDESKRMIEETNRLVKEFIDSTENVFYLDSISRLSKDREPIQSMYRDNVHINVESYQVYIDLLKEFGVNFDDYRG